MYVNFEFKIVGILWYNYMVVILLVYFICYVGYKMVVNICNGLMWIYKLNYNYKIQMRKEKKRILDINELFF